MIKLNQKPSRKASDARNSHVLRAAVFFTQAADELLAASRYSVDLHDHRHLENFAYSSEAAAAALNALRRQRGIA